MLNLTTNRGNCVYFDVDAMLVSAPGKFENVHVSSVGIHVGSEVLTYLVMKGLGNLMLDKDSSNVVNAAMEDKKNSKYPGLVELKAAMRERADAYNKFSRACESGSSVFDGNSRDLDAKVEELQAKYPEANLYYLAKSRLESTYCTETMSECRRVLSELASGKKASEIVVPFRV